MAITTVTPSTGALNFTGKSLTLAPQSIRPTTGSLTTVGLQPRVVGPRGIQPQTGSLAITGNRPSTRRIRPDTGSLGLFGNKPRVKTTSDPATGLLYFNLPAVNAGMAIRDPLLSTPPTPPDSCSMSIAAAGKNAESRYFKAIILDSLGQSGRRDPLLRSYFDMVEQDAHVQRSTISLTEGNPTPPSQVQGAPGFYRSYVPVQAGNWTVSIDMKLVDLSAHESFDDVEDLMPPPRLTIKLNPDVGLLEDVTADALLVTGWQTLTCAFTVTATGVVEIRREKRSPGMDDLVYWDNLVAARV